MNQPIIVPLPGGIDTAVGFTAYSLIIDNLSNQWLYHQDSNIFVPPYQLGVTIPLNGTQRVSIKITAPTGITQPSTVLGNVQAIASDTRTDFNPGVTINPATGTTGIQPVDLQPAVPITGNLTVSGAGTAIPLKDTTPFTVGDTCILVSIDQAGHPTLAEGPLVVVAITPGVSVVVVPGTQSNIWPVGSLLMRIPLAFVLNAPNFMSNSSSPSPFLVEQGVTTIGANSGWWMHIADTVNSTAAVVDTFGNLHIIEPRPTIVFANTAGVTLGASGSSTLISGVINQVITVYYIDWVEATSSAVNLFDSTSGSPIAIDVPVALGTGISERSEHVDRKGLRLPSGDGLRFRNMNATASGAMFCTIGYTQA